MGSVPHFAPPSIHSLWSFCSASESGFLGGISPAATRFHNSLSAGLPGTTISAAPALRDRSSFPLGLAPPWQSVQCDASSGAIRVSKSGGAATAPDARSRSAARERVRGMVRFARVVG